MASSTSDVKPDTSGEDAKQHLDSIPSLKLNDRNEMPMLAYGLGTKRTDDKSEDVINMTVQAIKAGFTHLDGAESYRNEWELGEAIRRSGAPRSTLFVTTKLRSARETDPSAALRRSLDRLGLDYVDLYLVHSPFRAESPEQLRRLWRGMEDAREAGLARSVGVSNFTREHLDIILEGARSKPAVNQIEYHPYLQHTGDLLPFCRGHGIAVTGYGLLTALSGRAPPPHPPALETAYADTAQRHGVARADVALRWALDQDIGVVTTSADPGAWVARSQVFRSGFKLTPEEVARIAEAGRLRHFRGFWTREFEAGDTR